MRSWPLLVLAAPAAAEVWSGWVGIAQKTGFGLVSPLPGIWPSLHLDTAITLAGRRRGLRGVRAAGLAGPRPRRSATGRAGSPSGRRSARSRSGMAGQVAYHLLAQAGMTRAPWAITTVVSCLPVLVLGMGTALAHMLRADAEATGCTGQPDRATGRPAVPVLVRRKTRTDQAACDRSGPGPVREPGPERSRAGTATRPRSHGTWLAVRPAAGGSGPRDRPQACRGGEARIAASVARAESGAPTRR